MIYTWMFHCTIVILIPPAPDNIYMIEVQRELTISCTASNPGATVMWIYTRKHKRKNNVKHWSKHLLTSTAPTSNLDPNVTVAPLVITSSTQQSSGCPAPQSFILNSNSSVAFLTGDSFDGVQPEDAGNYTCYSNGIPRVTVEIIVLCKIINSL